MQRESPPFSFNVSSVLTFRMHTRLVWELYLIALVFQNNNQHPLSEWATVKGNEYIQSHLICLKFKASA